MMSKFSFLFLVFSHNLQQRKEKVEEILGIPFLLFAKGTTWTLTDVFSIMHDLEASGIRDIRSLLQASLEVIKMRMEDFSPKLKGDFLELRETLFYAKKVQEIPVSSPRDCPPCAKIEPKEKIERKEARPKTKQDYWNNEKLGKIASTSKLAGQIYSFSDKRMLSKTCFLICETTFEKYFNTLAGAILLYLSAKINEKFIKNNFKVDDPQVIDKIRLGLVHCFGTSNVKTKRQSKKRKRMELDSDQALSSADQDSPVTKHATNRGSKRLFFLLPDSIADDVRSQFSFDQELTKEEYQCCIGWLLSRTSWLKKLYKDLLLEYPTVLADTINPFENYHNELTTIILENEARISVLPNSVSHRNHLHSASPSIQQNHSNITNINFL